jgi:hypothetical protein
MKSSLSLLYRSVRFIMLQDQIAFMEDPFIEKGFLDFQDRIFGKRYCTSVYFSSSIPYESGTAPIDVSFVSGIHSSYVIR